MKRTLSRMPFFGRLVLNLYRLQIALGEIISHTWLVGRWFVSSREFTNYTYDLSDENIEDLVDFVSVVTGKSRSLILEFISEIQEDSNLRNYLTSRANSLPYHSGADTTVRYGRRLGWYAIIRATKPGLVVETGVDKGLGTCVIAAALMKNQSEGNSGTVLAIDINPEAGALVGGDYADFVTYKYDDSLASLSRISDEIDLFIHDSDHSRKHESDEYRLITDMLSEKSVVISDNAHVSTELRQFANCVGRRYLFWQERPVGHFYAGSGIGAAFPG